MPKSIRRIIAKLVISSLLANSSIEIGMPTRTSQVADPFPVLTHQALVNRGATFPYERGWYQEKSATGLLLRAASVDVLNEMSVPAQRVIFRLRSLVKKPIPLIVIEGPSGAGKTTFMSRLSSHHPRDFIWLPAVLTRSVHSGDSASQTERVLAEEEFARRTDRGEILFSHYLSYWRGFLADDLEAAIVSGRVIGVESRRLMHKLTQLGFPLKIKRVVVTPRRITAPLTMDEQRQWRALLAQRMRQRDPTITDTELEMRNS